MTRLSRRDLLLGGVLGTAGAWLLTGCTTGSSTSTAAATSGTATVTVDAVDVPAGGSHALTATTRTSTLTIGKGGAITVPDGKVLTITVDGIETAQVLTTAAGTAPSLVPGTYTGDIVLTLSDAVLVPYGDYTFPFRQAVYVGADGVVAARSVAAAITAGKVTNSAATGVTVTSTGDVFNGLVVAGGSYTVSGAELSMTGNGRSDFCGYGAAVLGTGSGTTLVLDSGTVTTKGVVRAAVIAGDGANVVVKKSTISVADGTLAADYVPSVTTSLMQTAPWMLGISGNARATNVVGKNTKATYISSTVSAQSWGALSTDDDDQIQLTAINSDVAVTGSDGYGAYCNGTATLRFLGTRFTVPSYGMIATGGSIALGDSTPAAVQELNSSLALGLTAAELSALTQRATTIDSGRFGLMWHGAGSVTVGGATRISTKEAVFLSKGQQVSITVDGSDGADLSAANGTIVQVMTNDDPGPVQEDGVQTTTGVYTEPTGLPERSSSFDVTTASSGDVVATFSAITLKGSLYNAFRGGPSSSSASSGGAGAPPGGGGPGGSSEGKNLVVTLDGSTLTGAVSATVAKHRVSTISSTNYREIGRITNTPHAVINNGVLLTLTNGSTWRATGTSHLSSLTLDASSSVTAASGSLTVTVDGTATTLVAGRTYTGAIVVTAG